MPDRDEAWERKERLRLGDRAFGQEYCCLDGQTFITIRDKKTGTVKQIKLKDLYNEKSI